MCIQVHEKTPENQNHGKRHTKGMHGVRLSHPHKRCVAETRKIWVSQGEGRARQRQEIHNPTGKGVLRQDTTPWHGMVQDIRQIR